MEYISRADWGADAPKSRALLPGPVEGVAVHWEGPTMGTFPHSSCDDKVRGIQRYHMVSKGWADIAYSFLVCPHGTIYEGRGWGIRTAANGTDFGNDRYHAACYLGGEGDPLTPEAKDAYCRLVAASRRRWPNGQQVRPHGWFKPTACPGPALKAWIATNPWDQPAPTPAPTPEAEDMFVGYIEGGAAFLVSGNTKALLHSSEVNRFKAIYPVVLCPELLSVLPSA